MIPFIIGGVALAATGYGLAKLLEDDCGNNRNIDYSFNDNQRDMGDDSEYANEAEEKTKPFHVNLYDEEPQEDEVIEKYELSKIELYNTSLMELRTALGEIENLDRRNLYPRTCFWAKDLSICRAYRRDKTEFWKIYQYFTKTKEYVDDKLDALDSIIISQSGYEKYTDEDKKLVDNLMHICTLIDKVTHSKITNDKVTISREINRGFAKLETIIL